MSASSCSGFHVIKVCPAYDSPDLNLSAFEEFANQKHMMHVIRFSERPIWGHSNNCILSFYCLIVNSYQLITDRIHEKARLPQSLSPSFRKRKVRTREWSHNSMDNLRILKGVHLHLLNPFMRIQFPQALQTGFSIIYREQDLKFGIAVTDRWHEKFRPSSPFVASGIFSTSKTFSATSSLIQ
jgi:hypothetical protein